MNLRCKLRALRWSYSAFITAASLVAAQSALQGHGEGTSGAQMILALAATEALGAVALLIEPLELIACAVLLLVYAVAAVVSLLSGEWLALLRLLFYAVTVTYIVVTSRASNAATGLAM
jgi:hypothetical protein